MFSILQKILRRSAALIAAFLFCAYPFADTAQAAKVHYRGVIVDSDGLTVRGQQRLRVHYYQNRERTNTAEFTLRDGNFSLPVSQLDFSAHPELEIQIYNGNFYESFSPRISIERKGEDFFADTGNFYPSSEVNGLTIRESSVEPLEETGKCQCPPGPRGPAGAQGVQGEQGIQGPAGSS